jgi:hypothetical protein
MAQLPDGPASVALLCPEPRLRRILALALEADGLLVCDWPHPTPSVVVADLDSLGWDAEEALRRLGAETPMLLISVYPQHLHHLKNAASLQPPFRWRELTGGVRCLLRP